MTYKSNHDAIENSLMKQNLSKLPRLFLCSELSTDIVIELPPPSAHYLKNVLRMETGDDLRVFNAESGEFLATLDSSSKKSCVVKIGEILREPAAINNHIHLFFPPIKKDRLDFLIEKAVELGVTELHPILTQRGNIREVNESRILSQIIEASEQCERMDMPILHSLLNLNHALNSFSSPMMVAIERGEGVTHDLNQALSAHDFHAHPNIGFMVGPEGGWSEEERAFLLSNPSITPISLGPRILRVETACLICLAAGMFIVS